MAAFAQRFRPYPPPLPRKPPELLPPPSFASTGSSQRRAPRSSAGALAPPGPLRWRMRCLGEREYGRKHGSDAAGGREDARWDVERVGSVDEPARAGGQGRRGVQAAGGWRKGPVQARRPREEPHLDTFWDEYELAFDLPQGDDGREGAVRRDSRFTPRLSARHRLPDRPSKELRLPPADSAMDTLALLPASHQPLQAGDSRTRLLRRYPPGDRAPPTSYNAGDDREGRPSQTAPIRQRFVPVVHPAPEAKPDALRYRHANQTYRPREGPGRDGDVRRMPPMQRTPPLSASTTSLRAAAHHSLPPKPTLESSPPSFSTRRRPMVTPFVPSADHSAQHLRRDSPTRTSDPSRRGPRFSKQGRSVRGAEPAVAQPLGSSTSQPAPPPATACSSQPAPHSATMTPTGNSLTPAPPERIPPAPPPPTPPRGPSRLSSPSDPSPAWLAEALYGPSFEELELRKRREGDGEGEKVAHRAKRARESETEEEPGRVKRRKGKNGEDGAEEGEVWLDLGTWEVERKVRVQRETGGGGMGQRKAVGRRL